jgi:hypothetical protein
MMSSVRAAVAATGAAAGEWAGAKDRLAIDASER